MITGASLPVGRQVLGVRQSACKYAYIKTAIHHINLVKKREDYYLANPAVKSSEMIIKS